MMGFVKGGVKEGSVTDGSRIPPSESKNPRTGTMEGDGVESEGTQ